MAEVRAAALEAGRVLEGRGRRGAAAKVPASPVAAARADRARGGRPRPASASPVPVAGRAPPKRARKRPLPIDGGVGVQLLQAIQEKLSTNGKIWKINKFIEIVNNQ